MDPTIICQICIEKARPNEKYYCHYGGICCLSCKAFFRRCHRYGNNPKLLKCPTNWNNCDISESVKRTKCKKCRYDKCVQVGLDGTKVLIDEQDRKKYSHPKKKKKSIPENPEIKSKNNLEPKEEEEQQKSSNFIMDSISLTYSLAIAGSNMDQDVLSDVVLGHVVPEEWTNDQSLSFLTCLNLVTREFETFAKFRIHFKTLCPIDQHLLMKKNGRLLEQYILARYISAETGLEQLNWLLGSHLPPLCKLLAIESARWPGGCTSTMKIFFEQLGLWFSHFSPYPQGISKWGMATFSIVQIWRKSRFSPKMG
jgi:hypothetical protein